MLEHADASEMCISEMTVILMSLGVTAANFKVAELFCRNRFGDSAVDVGFERGIVAGYATGWMNDNVGQQRLYATKQRVSSAGERPSVATGVAAAQEGADEAMRQPFVASSAKEALAVSNAKEVLAASSTTKTSAASDVDVVEKNQMGGEKPVLLIGSPTCCIIMIKSQNVVERHARRPGGQGVITTMMRDANRVSEVKYQDFVEQCVRHLMQGDCSCMRICGTGGLVDSASSRRWRRVLACGERRVSCADLSRQCVLRGQDLVSSSNQSTSPRSWECVAATKRIGPGFT